MAEFREYSLASEPPVTYRIDGGDRIVYVNGAWNRFATEHAAPELATDAVIGRSLWEFVADPTTETLYRGLVDRARQGDRMSVLYRCDIPSKMRLMQMTITAGSRGEVRFESEVAEQSQIRQFGLWDRRARRSGDPVRTCSWCKRIEIGAHWVELDTAVDVLGLFVDAVLPPLEHVTCSSCYATVKAELEK